VILADSSAWVEHLRDTGSSVCNRLNEVIDRGEPLRVTEPVVMEVLAGATGEKTVKRLKGLLGGFPLLPVDGAADFERAASLYVDCRRGGETVRSMIDCLVAAVAIRTGARVLHADRDYDVLARHTALEVEPAWHQ
jgi:predicted nucleic acid-binding protein